MWALDGATGDRRQLRDALVGKTKLVKRAAGIVEVGAEHRARKRDERVHHGCRHARDRAEIRPGHQAKRNVLG